MDKRARLIFLALSLGLLILIGRVVTGTFDFLLHQFWFTAGLFLLILLSLIDQPHFSKDANIFINGVTGWISLLLVSEKERDAIWWGYFLWASYLILSSYALIWVRKKELIEENKIVQLISRVNREIGRPEALFSAFFLWGCVRQFGLATNQFNALLLFWVVFMILNIPSIASALSSFGSPKVKAIPEKAGILSKIISPLVAEVNLRPNVGSELIGKNIRFVLPNGKEIGKGIVIDDHIVYGKRVARIGITSTEQEWKSIGDEDQKSIGIDLIENQPEGNQLSISVVDEGSEIGIMVFHINPNQVLQEGEVLWVQLNSKQKAFYQIISGQIVQVGMPQGNGAQVVKVRAGQLGIWEHSACKFESITWVPPAGHIVHKASSYPLPEVILPKGCVSVGKVPNSDFPVHVNIEDIVTHNAAIIGVTGSGKSYLTFHLIEAMVAQNIKVLILDISRQHYLFLDHLKPTAIKQASEVQPWIKSTSLIAIHQFALPIALNAQSYPAITSEFVKQAFLELSQTKLQPGKNEPARLCIILEEAHSLIPEWQQVADKNDTGFVNSTSRFILQGRKYGMGCVVITQRTANVTKTILNQCNTIFALQSFDQTGLDFLKNYVGSDYTQAISTLPIRHAILVGKAASSTRPILFAIDNLSKRWNSSSVSEAKDKTKDT